MLNKFFKARGFTLVEVLIGLIILAIGILAIAGMHITAIKGTSFSNNITQASVLAQERLEFLKGLPLNDSRLNTGIYTDDINVGIFNGSYRAERNTNFVTIRYTISWMENNLPHSVSFSTIKSR